MEGGGGENGVCSDVRPDWMRCHVENQPEKMVHGAQTAPLLEELEMNPQRQAAALVQASFATCPSPFSKSDPAPDEMLHHADRFSDPFARYACQIGGSCRALPEFVCVSSSSFPSVVP